MKRLVLGVCLVVGVVQGLLWAFVAPGVPYKVLADGRFGPLPTTSTYHFVDVAIFALSGMAIGILLAVGAWQVRAARGWPMVVTLVGGSFLGAAIAWAVGARLAPGVDPASVGATAADSIVSPRPHRNLPGRPRPACPGRRRVHVPGRLERAPGFGTSGCRTQRTRIELTEKPHVFSGRYRGAQ